MPNLKIDEPFALDLGGELPGLELTWEEWGDADAPPERTVMVMPALSASCHARSSADDPEPGWWEGMIGPGLGIDTDRYRVICASILGSPFGSTSPVSINPETGKRWGPEFPQITPADQANVHARLLDHLGLEKIHAVVGSSLGGMQALQFGALHPDRIDVLVSIVATGKTTPGTVALRRVGRLAILLDPGYADGWYEPGEGPTRGLAIARELGTITYRSRDEFNQRFDWNPDRPRSYEDLAFEVEQYLAHQARRFVHRFDANCYLVLSRCMDMMDLGSGQPTYADGVLRIKARTAIYGVDRDLLIPASEQLHLSHLLENHGRRVRHEILSSMYGHDAFLKEFDWFGPRIRRALDEEW